MNQAIDPKAAGYEGYRQWKNWNTLFTPAPHEQRLYRAEFRDIPLHGKRLLDIGFGSGALLGWARQQGAAIAGIELQTELREAAQAAGIETFDGIEAVPDQSFDIITAFDVLEHIPREQLVGFLQQVRRIAAPEARVLFRVPNCQSAVGLLNQFGDATHVSMLSGPVVEQVCIQAGLSPLYVRAAVDPVFPARMMVQMLRPFQKLLQCVVKLLFRLAWSSGNAPLTANVVIVVFAPYKKMKIIEGI